MQLLRRLNLVLVDMGTLRRTRTVINTYFMYFKFSTRFTQVWKYKLKKNLILSPPIQNNKFSFMTDWLFLLASLQLAKLSRLRKVSK
jgi:hypothetical protein